MPHHWGLWSQPALRTRWLLLLWGELWVLQGGAGTLWGWELEVGGWGLAGALCPVKGSCGSWGGGGQPMCCAGGLHPVRGKGTHAS